MPSHVKPDVNVAKLKELNGSNPMSLLQLPGNTRLAELTIRQTLKDGATPALIEMLRSLLGIEKPPPVATGATLTARETIASTLHSKTCEAHNFGSEEMIRVVISDLRWKSDIKEGAWDLQAQFKDFGAGSKLGTGSYWLAKSKIAAGEDGLEFRYYLEGVIFSPPGCDRTRIELAKLNRKLLPIAGEDAVTIAPIESTPAALADALRKMWSFSSDDFPSPAKMPYGRAMNRMVQLLSTVPLHRLCKGYGQGDHILRAAVDLMKGVASGSGKNSTTLAHPDRRSRDIVELARATGWKKHKLPWVKLR